MQSYKKYIMLQIAFIRENREKVITALAKKNMDAKESQGGNSEIDEYKYLNKESIDKDLICSICQEPFIYPVLIVFFFFLS